MRILIQFLILSVLFVVCNTPLDDDKKPKAQKISLKENTVEHEVFDALVKKLIQSDKVKEAKNGQKVIVIKENYCAKNDCELLFKDYEDQIVAYSREGLFQRGIKNWVKVLDISVSKRQLKAIVKNGSSETLISIQL